MFGQTLRYKTWCPNSLKYKTLLLQKIMALGSLSMMRDKGADGGCRRLKE